MTKVRFVGLDVHKDSICIAVADGGGGEPEVVATVPHDIPRLVKRLRELARGGAEVKCCYEAGSCGFVLARALNAAKLDCIVIAPSMVPNATGARVKTDRRDAVRLARFLRSGDLVAIHVPDGETEAIRDLTRARLDATGQRKAIGQQLTSFLLRHGRRFEGKSSWGPKHLQWCEAQVKTFDHVAQQRVLADYVQAFTAAKDREAKLEKDLAELVPRWTLFPIVEALMALKGVKLLTAAGLVSEIGDFARFAKPTQFASYLGITPSEHSSGEQRRQGGITLAGNRQCRRLVVEAAWHYRFASLGPTARARAKKAPEAVRAVALKAHQRLSRRFAALQARGKPKNKAVVAVGRELACFIWAIANHEAVRSQMELNRNRKNDKTKAA